MDNLEELQEKLYTPERPKLPEQKLEIARGEPPFAPPPEKGDINPSPAVWRRVIIGVGIFILLAATVAVYVFFRGFYAFRKDRVELRLDGPAEIVAGEMAVWKLGIVNKNETELKDGEFIFQFPDFAQPIIPTGESGQFQTGSLRQTIPLPELKAGGLFEKEFKATLYGGENFERAARVVFKFKPSAGNITFETSAATVTKIKSFPVSLTVEAVPETVSGEKIEVIFRVKNEGETEFKNLRVRLEYPSGFRAEEASEKLAEFNNVWLLDQLLAGESKELTVKGAVSGLEGEKKVFRAFVESLEGNNWKTYKESGGETRLVTPPLSLYLNTDPDGTASVRPGETVFYTLVWQNNLDIPISNLTLKVKFEGDDFDLSTLEPATGFNSISKTITLNRDNYPAFFGLQPLERDELAIRVKVKEKISGEAKLPLSATLESTTKPEGLAVSKISASQNLTLEISSSQIFR